MRFEEQDAVGVGAPQGKGLHIPGEADDPGPGHGGSGLERSHPEEQILLAAFIGQAQIGDFKDPGRGGCRTAGLVVLDPDQFQGAGLLALPEAQRQGDRPGLVLLPGGRKELLLVKGRGDKIGQVLMGGQEGLESCRRGLELSEDTVPVGRGLLHRQGQGQQERRHPDAFKLQVVDVLGPDVQQLPAVPFDDALGAHEFHLRGPVGHEKGVDRFAVGLLPHPQGFRQVDEIAGAIP